MYTVPNGTFFFSFFLKAFFVADFAGAFAIYIVLRSGLGRRFLLVRDGALAWTFARARIGVRALPPNRQTTPVPQSAIGAHLHQALDVHRDFLAQVAFDRTLAFYQ